MESSQSMTLLKAKLHFGEGKSPALHVSLCSFATGIKLFQPGKSSEWQSSLELLWHFPPLCDSPEFCEVHSSCPGYGSLGQPHTMAPAGA